MLTAEEWKRLVKRYVGGGTPEQVDAVVARLVENPDQGVWHAAAQVSGQPCWCHRCRTGGAS